MASAELSARLRYLNDSAHLLAITAPATSRRLIARCYALMFENKLDPSEAQRQNACGACGTIMALGWDGTMQTESQPSRRSKDIRDGQGHQHSKALICKCETCGRKTRLPLNTRPQANRRKSASSNLRSMSTSQSLTKPNSGSQVLEVKTRGKKRARARKRGGLEAILAGKKVNPETSGFGLDLMDFMKKS
jgi:RNase P subunit RPR2